MKTLYCTKCGSIHSFNVGWTACDCGNMAARWLDPTGGTVEVLAKDPARARIIGMHNQFLASDITPGVNTQTSSAWRAAHSNAARSAGYIFDKSHRDCWACIFSVGDTQEVYWHPEQVDLINGRRTIAEITAPARPVLNLCSDA